MHSVYRSTRGDTGAAYLTLPMAWKESLGRLEKIRDIEAELADPTAIRGE